MSFVCVQQWLFVFWEGSFIITNKHLWHGTVKRVIFQGPYGRRDRQTIPTQVTITLAQGDSVSVTLPKEPRHAHRRMCGHTLTHPERWGGGAGLECQLLYFYGTLSKVGHVLSDHHDEYILQEVALESWNMFREVKAYSCLRFCDRRELFRSFPLGKIRWSLWIKIRTSKCRSWTLFWERKFLSQILSEVINSYWSCSVASSNCLLWLLNPYGLSVWQFKFCSMQQIGL